MLVKGKILSLMLIKEFMNQVGQFEKNQVRYMEITQARCIPARKGFLANLFLPDFYAGNCHTELY